ncbi:metallophosphoesterase family protein (plasmid) [Pontibacillus sp. ALD_SL1]|uniref:metallophosphoesterase n=1 Tax=Pontibacillus sp. ALD_SL1 TaxID=2777185 RepID=UPI001A96DA4B|nr:metallophosphoesterase [Pontibacillus sp. ALD_SL1]QST02490.1 metallophosphoesterase family protein [Pontibacillus sp. ALD_SL1]
MKLLFVSDLHFDVNEHITGESIINPFTELVKESGADHIVLSGDIANGAEKAIYYIDTILHRTGIPLSFVPGNHDVWSETDSEREYELLVSHPSCLIGKPHDFGSHVLIGSMGWYDYSFGLGTEERNACRTKKNKWWDGRFMHFKETDEDKTGRIIKETKRVLDLYADRPVLFVNHFVPYREFLIQKPHDYRWQFCHAYLGSEKMGELLDQYPNIETIAFGHTHKRIGNVTYKGKQVILNPLGYYGEWESADVKGELEKNMVFVTIQGSDG